MKLLLCILWHITFSIVSFAQSKNNQLHQLIPKWKLGDQKKVITVTNNQIFLKDSLISNTEVKGKYIIQVIDTVKNYTLSFFNEPNSNGLEVQSSIPKVDSVVNFFTGLIKNIEKESRAFKYELLVDKNSGQAFKVKNGDKFLKLVEELAFTMINELGEKKVKSETEIDTMKQKVMAYFKSAEPKILESLINQFNYLMQAYTYTFQINTAISQKTMIHDVNALGSFGGLEMPADLIISSTREKNIITIQTQTEYDKDFLLKEMKKRYKNMGDLTTSDFILSEIAEATFKTTNNWIISHKTNVVFQMKEVKVVNETKVSFQ